MTQTSSILHPSSLSDTQLEVKEKEMHPPLPLPSGTSSHHRLCHNKKPSSDGPGVKTTATRRKTTHLLVHLQVCQQAGAQLGCWGSCKYPGTSTLPSLDGKASWQLSETQTLIPNFIGSNLAGHGGTQGSATGPTPGPSSSPATNKVALRSVSCFW